MSDSQHVTAQGHPAQLEPAAWNRAGISRSHAYELMGAQPPGFPRPVKIGKASRFVSSEVDSWIAGKIAARDAGAARR